VYAGTLYTSKKKKTEYLQNKKSLIKKIIFLIYEE